MLGLPKSTEVNKQLPKKAIYTKFQMNTAAREKTDADISKITIVNEISAERLNTAEGETVKSFFVLLVTLKRRNFDEKNIARLSKLIPQNMLFILEYQQETRLAVYHTKLIMTPWLEKGSFSVEIKGLNLDKIWENIIIQVSGIEIKGDNTLDEQLLINEKQNKLQKEIERLEKQAKAEIQPKKKFELFEKIKLLRKEQGNKC